ncbi:penicillin-insensitive murein endopeptidase [Oceanicola granulosus HTCC2516]|uniref:Penicillin-insensitive murein endopeptidase n=1 Tax=Oceanicola granulosus (strain ATCC BAA-861 / DSM 15982 / KCTC 12143 / HTCC2516) TaxID=314256 RepID=Q2CK50_OCEGH|nr:penicillin-insensitive murein endopeptidase [Oceanicola granulosus]EAR52939.1 penicillin-insensitive murein endopeptidase [Oceanicola granulosus HTCC2516]
MVRTLAILGLTALLAACQGGDAGVTRAAASLNANPGAPRASTQNVNPADSRVAKEVFGYIDAASRQASESFGGYARGCQAGAVQLPETGPTWQAMRLSRNRNWAQPVTIDFIEDLSAFAATLPGWEGIYVGDMSQPRGGPMLSGHRSHQTGLDADIWMLPPQSLDLSVQRRETISSISMQRAGGAYVNDRWTPEHMALLRRAASDPRVARIFVFPGAKVAMCAAETGDRSWLSKIRPWYGHHYHFHVRLNCPPGSPGCEAQDPPPAGDGCADAQTWVDDILQPRAPDPEPPGPVVPRRELTMAQLPGRCQSVAASD